MTFADRYITFDVRIHDIGRNVDARFFTKTPLHPHTSPVEIFTRVLAHVMCFEEGLELSVGAFEPDLPSSYKRDLYDRYSEMVFLNEKHSEKIDKLLRHNRDAHVSLFFTNIESKNAYLHSLRGHLPETIKRISCFEFQLSDDLIKIAEADLSRFRFDALISDETLYMTIGDDSISLEIHPFELKDEYQRSLNNYK